MRMGCDGQCRFVYKELVFLVEEKSVEKRQVTNSDEFFIFYKQLLKTREEDIFVNLELLEGFQL